MEDDRAGKMVRDRMSLAADTRKTAELNSAAMGHSM
jgi:hypothetical protein